jgi:hypothetical protein
MPNELTLTDIQQSAEAAERAVRRAVATADGIPADKQQARAVAAQFGLDGNDTNEINDKLQGE